jgi:hypothetical protein
MKNLKISCAKSTLAGSYNTYGLVGWFSEYIWIINLSWYQRVRSEPTSAFSSTLPRHLVAMADDDVVVATRRALEQRVAAFTAEEHREAARQEAAHLEATRVEAERREAARLEHERRN